MLNLLPARLQMNVVLPRAADRCTVIFDYFYTDVHTPAAARRIEEDVAFSDCVQQENIVICEQVQRGLASPAYDGAAFPSNASRASTIFKPFSNAPTVPRRKEPA